MIAYLLSVGKYSFSFNIGTRFHFLCIRNLPFQTNSTYIFTMVWILLAIIGHHCMLRYTFSVLPEFYIIPNSFLFPRPNGRGNAELSGCVESTRPHQFSASRPTVPVRFSQSTPTKCYDESHIGAVSLEAQDLSQTQFTYLNSNPNSFLL